MNPLAYATIGIIIGLTFTLSWAAIAILIYFSYRQRSEIATSQAATRRAIAQSTIAIDRIRGEVSMALSSMDADKLHTSAITLQHGVKSFQAAIGSLSKLVYAAGAGDSMGMTPQVQGPYDPNYYQYQETMAMQQPSQAPVPPGAPDVISEFAEWKERAAMREAASLGHATPLPSPTLPDIQHEDGSELADDDHDDAYLEDWAQRHEAGKLGDLPGVTESGEGTGI